MELPPTPRDAMLTLADALDAEAAAAGGGYADGLREAAERIRDQVRAVLPNHRIHR